MAPEHSIHRRTSEPSGTGRTTGRGEVTGPHAGYDRYGRLDHYYYRCDRCGLESTDAGLRAGCPRCGPGVATGEE